MILCYNYFEPNFFDIEWITNAVVITTKSKLIYIYIFINI